MSDAKRMLSLRSSDNKVFELEEVVALRSEQLKHMIEDECHTDIIPLPNIDSDTLVKLIEFCNKHHEFESQSQACESDTPPIPVDQKESEVKAWNSKFLEIDYPQLFNLIMAANYLDVKDLLNLTTQEVADRIKDKKVEEVREIFNIKNDFTPDEEKALRDQNSWAYETDNK